MEYPTSSAVEPGPIETPIWQKTSETASRMSEQITPDQMALYAAELDPLYKAVEQAARSALPVEHVVRAVVHALTAKRPKTRYYVGRTVRIVVRNHEAAARSAS